MDALVGKDVEVITEEHYGSDEVRPSKSVFGKLVEIKDGFLTVEEKELEYADELGVNLSTCGPLKATGSTLYFNIAHVVIMKEYSEVCERVKPVA